MSAISSLGSSSGSLYLQQLQQQRTRNDQDDGSQSVGGTKGQGGFARFQADFEAAAKSIGVDPAKLPDIEKQIQDAVSKVQQDGGASGDKRSAIRDAISGVLKDNGIDPTKFDSAIKTQAASNAKAGGVHRHHGGHHQPQPETDDTQTRASSLDITPADVQPGQTTGTLVDVAA